MYVVVSVCIILCGHGSYEHIWGNFHAGKMSVTINCYSLNSFILPAFYISTLHSV